MPHLALSVTNKQQQQQQRRQQQTFNTALYCTETFHTCVLMTCLSPEYELRGRLGEG